MFLESDQIWMALVAFNAAYLVFCVLNLLAAIKKFFILALPYIIVETVRILYALGGHIMLMMVLKKQLNLGILIAYTVAGGFLLGLLFYMLGCSIALVQILFIVRRPKYNSMLLAQNLGGEQPVLNYKMPENKLTPEKNAIKGKPSMEPPVVNKNEKDIFASDFSEYGNKKMLSNQYI